MLHNDLKKILSIMSEDQNSQNIMQDGVLYWIVDLIWKNKEELKSLQYKDPEIKHKNFSELIVMTYGQGRQRELQDIERQNLEEFAKIKWEHFNSDNKKLSVEDEDTLIKCTAILDAVNEKLEKRELNDFTIINNSIDVITDECLQICFEEYCSDRSSLSGILKSLISDEMDDFANEYRRLQKYYNENLKNSIYFLNEDDDKRGKRCKIPNNRIGDVKLLYFASLDNDQSKFASSFVKEVFGEGQDIHKCIIQTRILLALSGKWKINSKVLDDLDYKMIDQIVEYLSMPVVVKGKRSFFSNSTAEAWIWTRFIAERLNWVSLEKKLSKSRKEKVFEYAKKVDTITSFKIKAQYIQSYDKFVSIFNGDSWFEQQKQVINNYRMKALDFFEQECKKFENPDDVILKVVDGNFKRAKPYAVDYRDLPVGYLKEAAKFVLKM